MKIKFSISEEPKKDNIVAKKHLFLKNSECDFDYDFAFINNDRLCYGMPTFIKIKSRIRIKKEILENINTHNSILELKKMLEKKYKKTLQLEFKTKYFEFYYIIPYKK